MTEEEARTKACPFADSIHGQHVAMNKCVASDCMAWRSFPAHVNLVTKERVPATGHCGLAGKP